MEARTRDHRLCPNTVGGATIPLFINLGTIAQVSQPAVSPTSSRPSLRQCHGLSALELLQARCLRYGRLEVCATTLARPLDTRARFMDDNALVSGQSGLTLVLSPGGERKSCAARVRGLSSPLGGEGRVGVPF